MTRALRLAVLGHCLALGVAPLAAHAHQQRLSYGTYRVHGAEVEVHLKFALADLRGVTRLDRAGDGVVSQADLDSLGALSDTLLADLAIAADGAPCIPAHAPPLLLDRDPNAGVSDGVVLSGAYRCRAEVRTLSVNVSLLELLPPGHTHLARIVLEGPGGAEQTERVVQAGESSFVVERAQPAPFFRFLLLGLAHIFTGADHLAFLLALLLLGGRLLSLVKIVTSFTVAHSITLALAATGVFSPPPRVIEPLIALSVVAVAVENLWALRQSPDAANRALGHRWMLTGAFGLVHGFGFASALQELALPRRELATALLSFNLGVECGQVAMVALALPLLAIGRKWALFQRYGPRLLSLVIAALGLFWLGARLVES